MGIDIEQHAAEVLQGLRIARSSKRKTDVGAWPAEDIRALADCVLANAEFQNSRICIRCDPTTFSKFGICETVGNGGNYKRAEVVKLGKPAFGDFIEFLLVP